LAKLRGTNFSGAFLSRANLWGADLSGADLTGAELSGATLIGTNLSRATLVDCSIHGISAWGIQLDGAKQENLIITSRGEPVITVDNLEVAQFIYLLLNHKKLRDVFNAMTERGVLILGRFGGGGLEVLQAIAAKLREEKYLPIIFDFERPQDRNYTETVKTLASLARFVIADLSGPSVPQELYATVPHFKIPFVPIIEAGRSPFSMTVDILEYPWVVRPPITFATTEELLEQLPMKVIAPAEEKRQARQKLLDELFGKA
jgi:Pentapeptide repeats (8 copies)